jgi:uncharacterized protein (TIGR02421 family)
LRQRLRRIAVDDVEHSVAHVLLSEKQRELDRLLELIALRGNEGFLQASIDLFGGAEAELFLIAKQILAETAGRRSGGRYARVNEVLSAAQAELAYYRSRCEGFDAEVHLRDDIVAGLMVSNGNLLISSNIYLPADRVVPLLHHEIGTHIVTHYNGSRQPLRQLQSGLAHYDELQEGMGVLAEYLSGNLSARRLQIIAARTVAVRLLTDGASFVDVFAQLTEQYGMPQLPAFMVTTRVFRGGGLTKDVVYLRGLRDLLAYLSEARCYEDLFVGKLALGQLGAVNELRKGCYLWGPSVLPRYLADDSARARLNGCGELTLLGLIEETAS